ncbi:MAG: undecaprenyldiphospho-muramoylpentapeptide beta-N-acetylglucosaminyltransferase [Desulfotignum sp.]|nr:undecaprenyldiphospho-muramoylpentapeptide beta-N-acetylglucosaminyltransferase [Desulfotignum sp.]
MTDRFHVIIAGGKTGGHLFPGIAVAQALQRRHPAVRLLFVGTDTPFEIQTLKTYGLDHTPIFSRPLKGRSLFRKLTGTAAILVSLIQSLWIVWRFKPDFVLGVGGYSSFAVVLAAWILRIPTAIQEQNAFPGITNRMLARFCTVIFTAFEDTRGFEQNPKTRLTGNPVREQGPEIQTDASRIEDIDSTDFVLLVTGGSQGASSINRAVVDMAARMTDMPDLFIIFQTGTGHDAAVSAQLESLGIRARVQPFFPDMPRLMEQADLMICRAGAGTLSEMAVKGVPAILVPYPFAADDHQTHNAQSLVDQGAAQIVADRELSGDLLYQRVVDLKSNPEKRCQMAESMAKLARPDAADRIAAYILETKES